jgi:hypothetical protein
MTDTDGVLAAIDACLYDSLSPDAMRWAPDLREPAQGAMAGWQPLPGTGIDPTTDAVVVAVSGVAVDELPTRWAEVRTRNGQYDSARFGCDDSELADWQQDYMRRMTAQHGDDLFFLVCTANQSSLPPEVSALPPEETT